MPLITDAVGRVLSGRYRLISPLGVGASAQVFLAEDTSLRRHVAIKLLQPALANDAGFLKRFRAEARSAAVLNHPHIARVFDWGEDEDGPYLVLEYLSGGSLLDLLERGVRLSVAQAATMAAQAARGLAHAHARGLVHRDVKPANLLFDDEGRVRVADFGVARALAEGAFTEPAGAVGTARYAAPEQAQGLVLDGRADVYSLALVTFESLTGYVPFVLDTAMGTLTARMGAVLPGHGALGPLQPILGDAAAPDLNARPDAAGLAQRIEALSATLPRPQALPLTPPQRLIEGPPTLAGVPGAATMPTAALDQTGVLRPPTRVAAGPDQVFDGAAFESEERGGRSRTGRRRRWPFLLVIGLVLALLAGGLVAALQKGVFTPSHPVPAVTGLTLDQARASLAKDHFVLSDQGTTSSVSVAPGRIVRQDPAVSTSLKQGSTVSVTVSKGLPSEHVPSLLGLGCDGAQRLLEVNHLKGACPSAAAAYSSSVAVGQVINWSYNNKLDASSAPYGSTVLMALSLGPPPVPIPSVQGDTPQQAQNQLQQAGFQVTESSAPSATTKTGLVDHTTPAAGTPVQKGTTVTIFVSSGPPTVQVPNESGKSISAAEADLQSHGLKVGSVFGPGGGTVFASVPEPGQTVVQGSTVNLYTA
jgi:serine/threonine protein kinase/beta-lactam-binding protein with PASTA domain